jgi:hypothetical protein
MNKIFQIILTALVMAVLAIFIIRIFSPEDTWLCEAGQWVMHGNPSDDAPTTLCK